MQGCGCSGHHLRGAAVFAVGVVVVAPQLGSGGVGDGSNGTQEVAVVVGGSGRCRERERTRGGLNVAADQGVCWCSLQGEAKPGWSVTPHEVGVRHGFLRLRRYDMVAQSPRGHRIAVEVKYGNAMRSRPQRVFDSFLNRRGGVGFAPVGRYRGTRAPTRAVLIRVPTRYSGSRPGSGRDETVVGAV